MYVSIAKPTNDWEQRGFCSTNRESADRAKVGHFLETTGVRSKPDGLLKLAGMGCVKLEKVTEEKLVGVLGRAAKRQS